MINLHRFCISVLLILIGFSTCYSQGDSLRVFGYVYDQESRDPLPGAYISVKESSLATMTDVDGYFEFYTGDTDTVIISFLGFEQRKLSVSDVIGQKIFMKLATNNLIDADVCYVYSPISLGYLGNFNNCKGFIARVPHYILFGFLLEKIDLWPNKTWRGDLKLDYTTYNNNDYNIKLQATSNNLFDGGRFYYLSFDLLWNKRKRINYIEDYCFKLNHALRIGTIISGINRRKESEDFNYAGVIGAKKHLRKFNTTVIAETSFNNTINEYQLVVDHHLEYLVEGLQIGYNYNQYTNYSESNFVIKFNYGVCIGVDFRDY